MFQLSFNCNYSIKVVLDRTIIKFTFVFITALLRSKHWASRILSIFSNTICLRYILI